MPSDLRDLLSKSPVFGLLNTEQRTLAAESGRPRQYQKGALIALYGDIWPYLFMVVEGQVDGIKESTEGRQLVVVTLKPGDIFWGLAFFNDDAPTPVTLRASTNSRIAVWSRNNLLPLFMEQPQALWQLTQQMIMHMQHASQIVEGLAFQQVTGRLANLLLDEFNEQGEPSITRNMTLDQIAARIGTTREQTCRTLYQFSSRGLIDITRTEFRLIDYDGLADVAGKS